MEQTTINSLNDIFNGDPQITINGSVVDRSAIQASLPNRPMIRRVRNVTKSTLQPRVISSNNKSIVSVATPSPTIQENISPSISTEISATETITETRKFVVPSRDSEKSPITIDLKNITLPNFDGMTLPEQKKMRAELLIKLNIISEKNTNYQLPNFAEHPDMSLSDLYLYHQGFMTYLSVNKIISNNKLYWILGCLALEAICRKIGISSVKGYASMQMKNSLETEMLLIEMGCQSVASNGSQKSEWPPMVQIIISSLLNLVIFIVVKIIIKFFGFNENCAETFSATLFDYVSGKKEIPPSLTNVVTQGVANNPSDPLSGLMSAMGNIDFATFGPMISNLFGGGANNRQPNRAPPQNNTVYSE